MLSPLQIGNQTVGFPIVQAALSGYSDWPMRVMARRLGAGYTVCEVMLDRFLVEVRDRPRNAHFLRTSEEERPVGAQLMGTEPDKFVAGALKLVNAGFDVIDINFGCPVKKVLGRCRGGYHLGQPDVALEIVRRTRDAVPAHVPVTVKMRRGVDDTELSREHFFRILDGAFAAGVSAVTVHGRTVLQGYVGPSRWEFLGEVKRHVGDRVILGSGDLFTAKDCLDMMAQTGVNGVTVARGAIGNPWIFREARALAQGAEIPPPPTVHEQREVIMEHRRLAESVYGPRWKVSMRRMGLKYAPSHPEFESVRAAFTQVKTESDWHAVLERWYETERPGRYPGPDVHKAQGSARQRRTAPDSAGQRQTAPGTGR